jgi:DNA polymerase-3 subunit epsilon
MQIHEIIFDTETTGFRPEDGERIIEIGAIEMLDRSPTGRTFHEYLNPEGRTVDPGAFKVHGISNEDLNDKPTFAEIAERFVEFIGAATLVAHNAPFDINFLNHEFARVKLPPVDPTRVVDTLEIARRKHPMAANSLDRLCERYGINNKHRTLHGALLDSELLSEVYIELLGGRQTSLELVADTAEDSPSANSAIFAITDRPTRKNPLPSRLNHEQMANHREFVDNLSDAPIWRSYRQE